MSTTTLTNEDKAIVHVAGLRSTRHRAVEVIRMMDGDSTDYRAMLAHTGGYSRHLSPADKLRQEWRTGETTREWEEFRRSQAAPGHSLVSAADMPGHSLVVR